MGALLLTKEGLGEVEPTIRKEFFPVVVWPSPVMGLLPLASQEKNEWRGECSRSDTGCIQSDTNLKIAYGSLAKMNRRYLIKSLQ